jgi:hypothetical protein
MKKTSVFLVFFLISLQVSLYGDAAAIAAGAEAQLSNLLNKPAMVSPATAVPLEKHWYKLETDAHIFSDEVSVSQVAAVLLDVENYHKHFDGTRSEISTSVVDRTADGLIVDFISTTILPIVHFKHNTPYQALVRTLNNTSTKFTIEIRQTPQDTEKNGDIKNLYTLYHVEEKTINGKSYTYIRMYTLMDADAGFLPSAKDMLERNEGPTSAEALQLIIIAAKTK